MYHRETGFLFFTSERSRNKKKRRRQLPVPEVHSLVVNRLCNPFSRKKTSSKLKGVIGAVNCCLHQRVKKKKTLEEIAPVGKSFRNESNPQTCCSGYGRLEPILHFFGGRSAEEKKRKRKKAPRVTTRYAHQSCEADNQSTPLLAL